MACQQWPDETPEELIEAARARGGDKEAAIVAKALGLPEAPRRKRVPEVVGKKPRHPAAPAGAPKQGVAWNEGGLPIGKLPRSGAGPVMRVVPRAHVRRRGNNDS